MTVFVLAFVYVISILLDVRGVTNSRRVFVESIETWEYVLVLILPNCIAFIVGQVNTWQSNNGQCGPTRYRRFSL